MIRLNPTPTRTKVIWSNSVRRAFTLTELMVSIGILAGLMAMVSMIFATATKSSGLAQSTTVVYRQLRQITEGMRRDLQGVDPSSCILGIARVDMLAYKTQQDMESARQLNDDSSLPNHDIHRADLLMLLTKRKFDPYIYHGPGEFPEVRHVIYGHANFAELVVQPDKSVIWQPDSERFIEETVTYPATGQTAAIMPAHDWHLARRIVGFPKIAATLDKDHTAFWPLSGDAYNGYDDNLDVLADVFAFDWDVVDNNAIWPGHFQYNSSSLQSYYYIDRSQDPPEVFRYDKDADAFYYFTNGYWHSYDSFVSPFYRWVRIIDGNPEPLVTSITMPQLSDFNTTNSERYWPEWFYVNGNSRVLLDPTPPANQNERLACYFLPACSEFKVEFTYDDPREIEINPASQEPFLFQWYDIDKNLVDDWVPSPRPIRWQSVPPGEKWIWSKLPVEPSDYNPEDGDWRDLTHPYRWPRAIRITISVYDQGNRLEEPVTQTIMHAW